MTVPRPAASPLPATSSRLVPLGLAVALLAAPLAACTTPVDRTVPTGSVSPDYHMRHPVVLAQMPSYLDVFPVGANGLLDRRTLHQLDVFAQEYRQFGQGSVVIRAPDRPADPVSTGRTVEAVRAALGRFGVVGRVEVDRYPVSDPRLASPLHLGYLKLQARVASRCGDWPDDLGSGNTINGWENRSYYNLGCASAKTLAAQLDDPRDLVAPRAEDPTDVQLRTRAIGLLRGSDGVNPGHDPGTVWNGATLNSPLNTHGGG